MTPEVDAEIAKLHASIQAISDTPVEEFEKLSVAELSAIIEKVTAEAQRITAISNLCDEYAAVSRWKNMKHE